MEKLEQTTSGPSDGDGNALGVTRLVRARDHDRVKATLLLGTHDSFGKFNTTSKLKIGKPSKKHRK